MDIKKIANPGALTVKPYVAGKSAADVMRQYNLTDVIKLASNESANGTPPEAIEALKRAVESIHVYPDPVSSALRERLGRSLGCPADCITVATGADGLLYEIANAVVNEGDECVIPAITFPIYDMVVRIMRGKPVVSRMDGYRIDLTDILAKLTPSTKMIFLTNPNNPTGGALPAADILEFLRSVPNDILVVIDEAYIEFAEPDTDPGSIGLLMGGMDNLVILRTFSKLFGLAGIRVGYGVAQKELIDLIHSIKPAFPVSSLAQAMALAALDADDFREVVIRDVKASRGYFARELETMGLEYVPSHTNFILIDAGIDSGVLFEKLCSRGVIVRPGGGYGLPTCIRVTFGTPEQNRRFFSAFREVMAELKGSRK